MPLAPGHPEQSRGAARGATATGRRRTPRRGSDVEALVAGSVTPTPGRRLLLMPVLRRLLTIVVAATVALLPAFSASASTADDLEAAKQKLATVREAANQARADAHDAEVELQQTEDRIAELELIIADLRQRAEALKEIVRKRALYAYTHAGDDIDVVIGADDPLSAARGKTLIDQANQKDNTAAKKLAVINSDLRDQTTQLRDEQNRQQTVRDELDARNNEVQALLADAQRATNELQAQLDREIAAQQEAERRAELERERAALLAAQPVANPTSSNISPGTIVANPGGGSFMCPVFGAAYTDDYGGPRGHAGIDMFVPTGTQAFAVKAGSVRYVPNEGAGGNTAYLDADDGNTYFYAHFSQFVGGARSVSQGEVIGLTGMTGNATGPHLHFEIRIGGVNGARIDPYPTLKAAGC
jgi:murein DD-endopeptidase MepM/ murein hydrolase activator NlpD